MVFNEWIDSCVLSPVSGFISNRVVELITFSKQVWGLREVNFLCITWEFSSMGLFVQSFETWKSLQNSRVKKEASDIHITEFSILAVFFISTISFLNLLMFSKQVIVIIIESSSFRKKMLICDFSSLILHVWWAALPT